MYTMEMTEVIAVPAQMTFHRISIADGSVRAVTVLKNTTYSLRARDQYSANGAAWIAGKALNSTTVV